MESKSQQRRLAQFESSEEIVAGGEDEVEPSVQGDVECQQLPVDRHAQMWWGVAVIVVLEWIMKYK